VKGGKPKNELKPELKNRVGWYEIKRRGEQANHK